MVADERSIRQKKENQTMKAVKFLEEQLEQYGDEPMPSRLLIKLAAVKGLNETNLKRARAVLDLEAKRLDGSWYWRLSKEAREKGRTEVNEQK